MSEELSEALRARVAELERENAALFGAGIRAVADGLSAAVDVWQAQALAEQALHYGLAECDRLRAENAALRGLRKWLPKLSTTHIVHVDKPIFSGPDGQRVTAYVCDYIEGKAAEREAAVIDGKMITDAIEHLRNAEPPTFAPYPETVKAVDVWRAVDTSTCCGHGCEGCRGVGR